MKLNLFYPAVGLVAVALFFLLRDPPGDELAFYGFAESNELELNYNQPGAVVEIMVQPGQAVDSGQALLVLDTRPKQQELADQAYRIEEETAERADYRARRAQELARLEVEHANRLATLDEQITELQKEIAFKTSLSEELTTVDVPKSSYQPLREELAQLENHRERTVTAYEIERQALESSITLGDLPARQRIRRLQAEARFDSSLLQERVVLTAPVAGLVGNINCREGEYKSAFANLITFYEPHSELVKGYVHENLAVEVGIGDVFEVISLQDESVRYRGEVTGLGSRIVEIPVRLRKFPDNRSYGREVAVRIPADNHFLQKEKVSLRFVAKAARK
ncbi:HlyD family secretion protein [Neolewinella sp.]|uniref:HlyD family secretion protein n=1 Tax=Neolewinella sp. TaxID=2993543 RepID=UPI003B51BD68